MKRTPPAAGAQAITAYPGVWINPKKWFSMSLLPQVPLRPSCTPPLALHLLSCAILRIKLLQHRVFISSTPESSCDLRPLLPASDNEPVAQRRVHGEHRPCVSLGHQPDQEMILPHVHISIYGTSERQVILQHTAAISATTHTLAFLLSFKQNSSN